MGSGGGNDTDEDPALVAGADRLDVAAIERPVALPCRLPDRGDARAHAPGL